MGFDKYFEHPTAPLVGLTGVATLVAVFAWVDLRKTYLRYTANDSPVILAQVAGRLAFALTATGISLLLGFANCLIGQLILT